MIRMLVNPLGWTLIHSLWQGAALALLFAVVNLGLGRARANARYVAAYLSLLAMPVAAVVTFVALTSNAPSVAAGPLPRAVVASLASPSQGVHTAPGPLPYLAMVVWFWLTGVLSMSAWSAAGWAIAQRLKFRGKQALPEAWQQRLVALAARLEIRRTVRIYQTALAQVPAVIGWIRPVILIPAGALLNLTPQQLEAVIAHELAHVGRYDYLANLLQSAIEIVMFYHPAVWWLGKRIRAEREHCCDDLAIAACGDRVMYARALTALEELRGAYPQFAMAATGGSLAARIRRLLGKDEPRRRPLPVWMAVVTLLAAFLGAGAQSGPASKSNPAKANPQQVAAPREGYLAGLVDAGYTDISVEEIIELKNNGVTPDFIKAMLNTALGKPSPKQLIHLRNNGLSADYARAAASSHIADLTFERLVPLRQNGVNVEYVGRIHALGFGPFSTVEAIELQRNGALRPDLFEALKESGYAKVDVRQIVEAQRTGLSPQSLRSLHAQQFSNLTLEQVLKLKRAGVI